MSPRAIRRRTGRVLRQVRRNVVEMLRAYPDEDIAPFMLVRDFRRSVARVVAEHPELALRHIVSAASMGNTTRNTALIIPERFPQMLEIYAGIFARAFTRSHGGAR